MKIGFIGLGNMGLPMSKNLLASQHKVVGLDLNAEACERFREAGGEVSRSLADMAATCSLILTSLPSSEAAKQVYLADDGLLALCPADVILIDTSTIAPNVDIEIGARAEAKGLSFLAAPVSGGVIGAEQRTLTFMVGGPKETLNHVKPYLMHLGLHVFHLGERYDSGTNAKLINNLLIGFYTAGVAEALTLAQKSGLNLDFLFDVLSVSYGQSRIYERNYKSFMAKDDYEPGFTLALLNKDLRFAMDLAASHHVKLPISQALVDLYADAEAAGLGDKDMSVVYTRVDEQLITFKAEKRNVT